MWLFVTHWGTQSSWTLASVFSWFYSPCSPALQTPCSTVWWCYDCPSAQTWKSPSSSVKLFRSSNLHVLTLSSITSWYILWLAYLLVFLFLESFSLIFKLFPPFWKCHHQSQDSLFPPIPIPVLLLLGPHSLPSRVWVPRRGWKPKLYPCYRHYRCLTAVYEMKISITDAGEDVMGTAH